MWSVNGSTLRPSAATMNGTRCAIRPAMNATSRRQPVELGHRNLALGLLGRLQRRLQLRPALQCIGSFAGLDLSEFGDDLEALGLGERLSRPRAGLQPKAGTALLLGRDAVIASCAAPKLCQAHVRQEEDCSRAEAASFAHPTPHSGHTTRRARLHQAASKLRRSSAVPMLVPRTKWHVAGAKFDANRLISYTHHK